jgi:ABC-type glycerol-3-phosphate transport system substrate-binding protein
MVKRISIIALLFTLVAVCTSIGLAQDTVTVHLWMHDHPPRVPLDKDLIAKFEADNPTVKVEYTVVPDQEWDTTLATALASGKGPDLFNQATFAIGQFYNQGILTPVDPVAAGYKDQDSIYAAYESGNALLAGATFDDKLYGLPTELSAYACYTNNALWKEAGLDPEKDFPTNWEKHVNDNGFAKYAYFFMVNSSASPEVQAASWKLAGYLTSNPKDYLNIAGLFQAKADYVATDDFKNNKVMPVFLQELSVSSYHPRFNGFTEVADALMRARDRVIGGGESMDTVLPEAQQEVSDILATNKAAS